jgi:hypothetical protein
MSRSQQGKHETEQQTRAQLAYDPCHVPSLLLQTWRPVRVASQFRQPSAINYECEISNEACIVQSK